MNAWYQDLVPDVVAENGALPVMHRRLNPGHTMLTRIPFGASSAEALVVSPTCPCLEATYADPVGKPRKEFTEPTLR